MEATKILTADILDIIFEGQNKDYGAYQLRKFYHRRLQHALLITVCICISFILMSYFVNRLSTRTHHPMIIGDIVLAKAPKQEPVPIPKLKQPPIKSIKDVTIRIVKEPNIPKEQMPPTDDQKEMARIGFTTENGQIDNATHPPHDDGRGVIEKPAEIEKENRFIPVEIESSYPGGMEAWIRFLQRTLRYPPDASEIGIEGAVMVRFTVDTLGNTSEVEAIQGPEALRAEAIRVIRLSGRWQPALQNGKKVKTSKIQLIKFKIDPS